MTVRVPVRKELIEKSLVYDYWEYSCYLDTLLVIILKNLTRKWRYEFVEKEYSATDFSPLLCGSKRLSIEEVIDYASKMRTHLYNDINILMNPGYQNIKCTDVRRLLATCLPNMIQNGRYVTYNPAPIYDLLCDLFPSCKIVAPFILYKDGIPVKSDSEKLALFDVWDYMGSGNGNTKKEYLWDDIDSDILVFVNNSAPVILKFNEIGIETSVVKIEGYEYKRTIEKVRSFGEVILDNKYRLTGVIILQGYVPGKESGIHYVGYLVDDKGGYYYYNDTKSALQKIDRFPNSVWEYSQNSIPQMYFYARQSF